MNFILLRLRKRAHGFGPPDGAVAHCYFEGIWTDIEVAKEEARFASAHNLYWTEVESREFKDYLARGYEPMRIFKASYRTPADPADAPGTGLWLLYDYTEPREP